MHKLILPVAAALLAVSTVHGQILSTLYTFQVGYSFAGSNAGRGSDAVGSNGDGGSEAPNPLFTDPSVTLGNITRGGSMASNTGYSVDDYGFLPTNQYAVHPRDQVYNSTVAGATTQNQYITFMLTPTENIALTSLVFGAGNQNGGSDATGLSYSTDGTTFNEITPTTDATSNGAGANYSNPIIGTYDLSTLGTLSSSDTLTFRLFFLLSTGSDNYADSSYSNPSNANGLDVEIDGMTVVPEPGTWAMMVAGGGLLLGAQRLRRRRNA